MATVNHPLNRSMDNKSLNNSVDISNQTSNSSTASASEVLIRSTQVSKPSSVHLPTSNVFDISGSSQSSTGSQRVRIKAKYLREVPSPFQNDVVPEKDFNIPPALIRTASPKDTTPFGSRQRVPVSIDQPVSQPMSSGSNVYSNKGAHPSVSSLKQFRSDSVLIQGHQNQHQIFTWEPQSDTTALKITQYQPGQRRKVMQESLGKKKEHKAPVKRYVQPNFINPKPSTSESSKVANLANEATTVAAMTAAAVAATAPFLKSQSDLEMKINGILDKLDSLDKDRKELEEAGRQPSKTDEEVERRLHELADIRLQQMERIQQQQLEWQTRLMSHLSLGGVNPEPSRLPFTGTSQSRYYYRAEKDELHQAPEGSKDNPPIKIPLPGRLNTAAVSKDYFTADNQPPVVEYKLATPITNATKRIMTRNTHSTQTSPLDTPAPRRRPPLPMSKDLEPRTGRGLLEEILRKDTEANDSFQDMNQSVDGANPIDHTEHRQRSEQQPLINQPNSVEKQAADMITELRELKTEMKTALQDVRKIELIGHQRSHVNPHKSPSDSAREEAYRQYDRWQRALDEPTPVDKYLKRRQEQIPVTTSQIRYRAPVISPACAQARALLKSVQEQRANLEDKLETIYGECGQDEPYTFIENLYKDGSSRDRAHIKKAVDERIEAIDKEIQRELSQENAKGSESVMKDVQPTLSKRPPRSLAKPPVEKRGTTGAPRPNKKKARSKIDTGLRKTGKKDMVETKNKKKTSAKEKENRPMEIKPKGKPAPIPFYKDEEYMTRVYGKAAYSPKTKLRSEPYLRFNSSPPRQRPIRPLSSQFIQGPIVKSSKIQTSQKKEPVLKERAQQYDFDPDTNIAVPSSDLQGMDAPSPEQLNPMAIPLREHKIEGIDAPVLVHRKRASGKHHIDDDIDDTKHIPMAIPLKEPQIGGNDAPVYIHKKGGNDKDLDEDYVDNTEEGSVHDSGENVLHTECEVEPKKRLKPQLKIQTMPSIDIQPTAPEIEILEEQTEKLDEDKIKDVPVPGYVDDEQFQDYVAVADEQLEADPVDELPIPGIALAGQSQHEPPYHGPPFPPEPPPPLTEDLRSNTIASDIRRRELLHNQAVEWIEQELMARMVSDMYQRQEETRVKEQDEESQREGEVDFDNSVSDISSNGAIIDRVGGAAGLQLFVDAGQPVDQGLVLDLIREVIAERVAATLSQQEKERSPIRDVVQVDEHSDIEEGPLTGPIATPEVTPVATPVGSPPARRSMPSTPVETPTPSESDSVQELIASLPRPISAKEERRLNDLEATIEGPSSPVKTPERTPPPSPVPSPLTPEPSLSTPATPLEESPLKVSLHRSPSPRKSPSPEPWTDDPPLAEEDMLEKMGVTEDAELPATPEKVEESLVDVTPLPANPMKNLPDTPPLYKSLESSETSEESTHDLTSTETTDKPISEGEWLNERSQGEVVRRMTRSGPYISSSEDTILQTEEMEDLTMDEPPSEGEVVPKKFHFNREPALALLAKINQQPPGQGSKSMMNNELSLGEVAIRHRNRLPPSGFYQQSDSELEAGEVKDIKNGWRSPGEVIPVRMEQEIEDFSLRMSHLKTKVSSDEVKNQEVAPPLKKLDDQLKEESEDVLHQRESESSSDEVPSRIPVAKPRVIQVASKARSPEGQIDHNQKKDPDKDETGKHSTNFAGTQTLSDFGTRTLTPDALNMDAYLQSGYLSQTFSQSEPATTDFEQTGTLIGQNTLNNNGTLNMSIDSLEMSRDKLQMEKGTKKFMVTLPTAHELEGSLSQSDIEIEKDDDEISDVSEIM